MSVDSGGAEGFSSSEDPCLSADGQWVAFASVAPNPVPRDANGLNDVFVHDRQTGGFALAAQGLCPGPSALTISNATVNGRVAIHSVAAGVLVKPTPPCQGLALTIAAPALRGTRFADAAGGASLSFHAPAGACGLTIQAAGDSTCTASHGIVLSFLIILSQLA